MARTVGDVLTRALQHNSLVVAGETPDASDTALALDVFNAMFDGFFADGLVPVADETATTKVKLNEGVVYTAASALPVLDRHFEGLAAMLAVLIADSFEAQLKQATVMMAKNGRQRIDAAFMPSMVADLDRALKRFPSTQYWPVD